MIFSFQVDDDDLWSAFSHLVFRIVSCSQAGVQFGEQLVKTGYLKQCFKLKERTGMNEGADDFLTWWLARSLRGALPSQNPFATLKGLVRCIPARVQHLSEWMSRDETSAFASKCAALILLYQLELLE